MSRKTHPDKCSTVRKSAARQSTSLVARFDLRTKLIACVVLASLIAGVTYASWLPSKSNEGAINNRELSKNDPVSAVKHVSTLSPDELAAIPPEALRPHRPEPRGYNASQGGLPPGALPPGVMLPGITESGRTMAQGYGVYDGVRPQFTGKERDGETGLDYFGARYYSSSQGRFTSPDELQSTSQEFILLGKGHPTKQALPNAELTNPQSLNKYHYALNNPLRYVDPDGQEPQDSAEIKMQQAIRDLNSGRITEQQYWDRLRGGGVGAIAGLATILAAKAGAVAWTTAGVWATRNPQAANQITQELVQASSGNPVPASGVRSLVSLTEETFQRAVTQSVTGGVESVAGFKVFGIKGLVGETYNRSVFLLEAEKKGAAPLSGLVSSLVSEAKGAGAKELRIIGVAVTNPGLFNAKTAARYGFTFRRVNEETVELVKKLK